MAHFWIPKLNQDGQCWAALPLGGPSYRFMETEPFVRRVDAAPAGCASEILVRISHEAAERWFLVVAPGTRLWVNGQDAWLGARVLADRDEIRFANGRRLYFSSECLPQVLPFPGAAREVPCARCRNPIGIGVLSVACPTCKAWCHQTDDLPCWRYPGATHCPGCDQSNDPEVGFRWSPIGL
jgi:hypothetical protein